MKRQLLRNSSVLFVVIVFSLMSGVALAQKKHWFVVKDKNGVCKVIEAETVAGPFKTMKQAEKRRVKDCPKRAGQATEKLRPRQEQGEHMRRQQEQVEPMRRQHQQREDPQQRDLKQQQKPHQQQQEPQRQLLKQQQEPQHRQQTGKMKGKAQEKIEGAKSPEEKVKQKTKEPIPSDKKN